MERYSRQIVFDKIGKQGQEKLLKSSVLIIGCGGLGCFISTALARAGIGRIKLCDRDLVELENLQRQILFDEDDVKQNLPKAVAAANKLKKVNSEIRIEYEVCDVNFSNIENLISGFDVVMDATDNFETRFVINDACVKNKIPWIHGACVRDYGIVMPIIPGATACYRCLLSSPPPAGSSPTCDTVGVITPVVGTVAMLQVSLCLKLLTGGNIDGCLYTVEMWDGNFRVFKVEKNPDCSCCAKGEFDFLEGEEKQIITGLCGRNAVYVLPAKQTSINFKHLSEKLSEHGRVEYNEYLLKFYFKEFEITVFPDARVIIKGTEDFSKARSIYSKFIGA